MGRGKRKRLSQRVSTGATLKIAVVTSPTSSGGTVSLARDVELVKASVMYADEVELVSLGAVMLAGVAQLAEGGQPALLTTLTSLDDDTIRYLSDGRPLPTNWRAALKLLSDPAAAQLPGLAGIVDQVEAALQEPARMLAETSERLIVESGAGELLPAMTQGLVRLSAAGFDGGSTDAAEVLKNWLDLIKGLLLDRNTRLVLDDTVGDLATALIREGGVQPHPYALLHAGQAAVGSGLVARLPSFPDAPLDELLDLRTDLAGPLGKYRASVVGLAAAMRSGPFDRDLSSEIDDLWLHSVQPALNEITEGMHEHGLVKELARTLMSSTKELIGGGSALYVGFAELASVNNWVSTVAGVTGPALHAVLASKSRSTEQQAALRAHDLFYLYETQKRLGG